MNEQVCPLPKCALLVRYQLSPSPCQGNTACHHHLPPIQTFPCHQYVQLAYNMVFQEVSNAELNLIRKASLKTKYCMRPPLRPALDSLYCLSLTSLRLAGSWLQIWQNWLLIKFDPARSFPSNYLLAPAPQLFNPHHLNTTCGCYMRKLMTEHQIGTSNKI